MASPDGRREQVPTVQRCEAFFSSEAAMPGPLAPEEFVSKTIHSSTCNRELFGGEGAKTFGYKRPQARRVVMAQRPQCQT